VDQSTGIRSLLLMERAVPEGALARLARRVPLVSLAGSGRCARVPTVRVDNVTAIVTLTRHRVLDHGYRDLAFVGEVPETPDAEARARAVEQTAAELGVPYEPGGNALVTWNGDARKRLVRTLARAGAIRVSDRRVEERRGKTRKFSPAIVPPTVVGPREERGPPTPFLHGLSTRDFAPALEAVFGSSVGLPSSVITRLLASSKDENRAFMGRDRKDVDDVDSSANGVQVRPPRGRASLCLVTVGVRLDGQRARGDHRRRPGVDRLLGQSPSDLRHRGMRAPVVALGDGAAGFSSALFDVVPETKSAQRLKSALLPP